MKPTIPSRVIVPLFVLLSVLAPGALKAQPSGLVGWWRGESNILDSAGGHDGFTNQGVFYVPGTNGQAFDIEGGIVKVPDSPSLRPLTNVTVQAWVKGKPWSTFRYMIAKAHAASGVSYALYTGSGGGASFFVNLLNTNNADVTLLAPAAPLASVWDDNWHQLTGTFDGQVSRLYLDGTQVGGGTTNFNANLTNISYVTPQPLIMGAYRLANDLPFVGNIDEVKIFSVALSDADVADTFTNSASPAATNGLISWYRGEGNALDSWGTNNGTTGFANPARVFNFTPDGKFGAGFFPNGNTAIIPDAPDLCPSNVTVQAWVKSVSPSTFRYMVTKSRGQFASGQSYALYTGGTGGAFFFVNLGTNGNTDLTLFSPGVPAAAIWDGAYHLLTGTFDGTACHLFLDGFEQGIATNNISATFSNIDYTATRQLLFGDYETPPGLPWVGFEDDIQLYNRALAPSEVLSNFVSAGNLVSWWNANSNANDSISGNNGTLAGGASYAPSRTKVGAAFNTVGGAVIIPDSASLQVSNITLQAEVGASFPGTNRCIISKSFNSSFGSYALATGPSGGLQFYVNVNGTQVSSPDAGIGVWDGNFHTIDGTYDGVTVRLFVDGKEVGSGTPAAGQIQYGTAFNSGELLFGDFVDTLSTNSNFAGIIDDVKLYASALPAAQIDGQAFHSVLITSQPQSVTVTSGANAVLSVAVQGPAPLTYQWLLNGTNIAGATSSILNLTNVQAGGSYSVRINSGGALYAANTITNNFTTNKIVGQYLQFGAGTEVEITNTPAYETEDFTVQLYARATSPGTFKWMFSKSRDPSFFSASYGLYTGSSGGAIWFVTLQPPPFSTNSFGFVTIDAGTSVWDGKWHQFTGVWANSEFLSLYLDGTNVNTVDTFGGTIDYEHYFLNGDLMIGDVLSPASNFHFPGDIDEVKYFDHALTADDVMDSYTNQAGFGATNGLINYWRFDGNTVDAIAGNDGRVIPAAGTGLSDIAVVTVVAPAARLINAGVVGANFSATVSGPTGDSYILQRSSNLSTWTPILTNVVPFTFSDPMPAGATRFYRAVKGN